MTESERADMHTLLPWIVGSGASSDSIYSSDDVWIADCVEGSPEANAALIVRAVNCHDDLVAAGRALLAANTRHDATEPDWLAAVAQMRAAIAKAEGREP